MDASAFRNRLAKNAKHFDKWAKRQGLTAYRLYDFDIPEFSCAVDRYGSFVHLALYPKQHRQEDSAWAHAIESACQEALALAQGQLFVKTHQRRRPGETQYRRQSHASATTEVLENGLRFEVNLSDFLDVGLFLDHRNTRQRVRSESQGKRVLNLFSYTGSFSVYAAAGGATSTLSVDLSGPYGAWAQHNLALNGCSPSHNKTLSADVLQFLETDRDFYDLIVVDPPSFSQSDKMSRSFDIRYDHKALLCRCMERLAPGGHLYFSTNFMAFELDPEFEQAVELTPKSLPEDFRRTAHRCWRMER